MGILPQDFPSDLPLLLPASQVDLGPRDGSRYVSLLSATPTAQVDRDLIALVRAQGWSAKDEAGGSRQLSKGGRKVRLRIEDARPGTLYHFEW